MTDEANVGAEAPAQERSAPIDIQDIAPNEVGSQVPQPEKTDAPAEEKPSKNPREAIRRASEKVKREAAEKSAKEADGKAQDASSERPVEGNAQKADAKSETRNDAKTEGRDGEARPDARQDNRVEADAQERAKPKPLAEDAPFREAPARFKGDQGASEAWNETPEAVRGAVHRITSEMEKGIEKYRADSEAYDNIRDFADMAQSHGTNLRQALENYVSAEQLLAKDPIAGLSAIADRMGYSLRDIAAHVLNQSPDQVQSQHDAENRQLRAHVEQLTQRLNEISTGMESQQAQQVQSTIQRFAAETDANGDLLHPRMDEIEGDMVLLLQSGRAGDLQEAYELADRLNPSPFSNAAHTRTFSQEAAHTRTEPPAPKAAGKSIAGAPSSGSELPDTGPAPSIKEALRRAARRTA